ncbi:MAG TPA: hypothetical protein VGJ84_06575, partial [Polyangiaceae bacterium]
MNTQIRRAALRAAGKVAFGATLSWGSVTACGGKVEYPADESATVQSATPAAESEAPSSGKEPDAASSLGEASRTSSLACVGQLDQNTASSVTAVELDCCVAFAKY